MTKRSAIIFDVETTGLSPGHDRVIEIGAINLQGEDVISEFHSLVNPGRAISEGAEKVHGITDRMLVGQLEPKEVFPSFHEFISNVDLIAHNARFDVDFLKHEFGRLNLDLTNKCFCTLEISRRLYPGLPNHRLETVYNHLFGSIDDEICCHRALDDAKLVMGIWLKSFSRKAYERTAKR